MDAATGAPAGTEGRSGARCWCAGLRLVEILSERTGRQITEDDYPQLATLASAIKFIAGG